MSVLTAFASIFGVWQPRARTRFLEIVALALILLLGAVLRFWALGAVGLHGDEASMALATQHIVRHGTPVLPSGMFYPRGILQLYLMAASIKAFGTSEWALRFPSVLCGVLLIVLAYLSGRRFLTSPWNLAFTAAVALLPTFIEDAQTARMYVFLVTSVAAYTTLVFEWERTGRGGFLVAAVAVLLLGVTVHQLAVFAAFIVLYPGLVRGDARKCVLGALAFAVILVGFMVISHWIDRFYPAALDLPGVPEAGEGPLAGAFIPRFGLAALVIGCGIALALAMWVARAMRPVGAAIAAAILIAVAVIAELVAFDHVAFLALAASVVLVVRFGREGFPRLAVVLAVCAAGVALDLWLLHRAGIGLRQSVGALTGWPSIWPDFAIAHYSPVATVALAAGIVWGCWRLARGQRIPDFLLFIVLGVWIPLLLIGVFRWSIPPRYVAAQSFPMLLGAFAAVQWLVRAALGEAARVRHTQLRYALAAVVCLLVANPSVLPRSAYGRYADHPDHLGAAQFIRSQHLGPRDILVAENVLEQTYYLGRVDYWLEGIRMASEFLYKRDGRLEDFYTGTPLIGTGAQLEALIARPDRGAIYIIGSGEQQEDGRSAARGAQIQRILRSLSPDVVYVGRDHLTKVWKIPAAPG